MRKLLYLLLLFPLAVQAAPYLCGDWTPANICNAETGEVEQSFIDSLTTQGKFIHQIVESTTINPPTQIHPVSHAINNKEIWVDTWNTPDSREYYYCDQVCLGFDECPYMTYEDKNEICQPVPTSPYVCDPWVDASVCDAATGAPDADYLIRQEQAGLSFLRTESDEEVVVFNPSQFQTFNRLPPSVVRYFTNVHVFANANGTEFPTTCTAQCPVIDTCPEGYYNFTPQECRKGTIQCDAGQELLDGACVNIPPVDPPVVEDPPVDPPVVDDPPVVEDPPSDNPTVERILTIIGKTQDYIDTYSGDWPQKRLDAYQARIARLYDLIDRL